MTREPEIAIERDAAMRYYEINIWLKDESNFCQVIVHDNGRIEFRPKEAIAAELVSVK